MICKLQSIIQFCFYIYIRRISLKKNGTRQDKLNKVPLNQ